MSDDWGNDPLVQGRPPAATAAPAATTAAQPSADWGNDALSGPGAPAAPQQPSSWRDYIPSWSTIKDRTERIGREALAPLAGINEVLDTMSPPVYYEGEWRSQRSIDAAMHRQNQEHIDKIRSKESGTPVKDLGFNWEQLGVDVANPINWATGAAAGPLRALGVAERYIPAGVGALTAAAQPTGAKTLPEYYETKSEQLGTGAAFGEAGDVAARALKKAAPAVGNWFAKWWDNLGRDPDDKAFNKAAALLTQRVESGRKGGGATAQDMIDLITLAPHKPQGMADVGSKPVAGLVGKVYRQGGGPQQTIEKWLGDRDLNASTRLSSDVNEGLSPDSPFHVFNGLVQARSAAAKPLFEEAFEGGSVAPLKTQFETAWNDAGRAEKEATQEISKAQDRVNHALAEQQRAGNDVYLTNSANTEVREAQSALREAQGKLQQAQTDKQMTADNLHLAQADEASGKPGAVWSPRIARFLTNPRIKQGINKGLQIERDTAMAENRAMNNAEYGITGINEAGEPVVEAVPTMRLLAVAKEGLDRMLQSDEFKNPITGELNKEGVALDKLRGAYLDELDKINPKYKVARAQWGGDTQSLIAMQYGEGKWLQQSPDQIKAIVDKMSPSDREFSKLGLAGYIRKRIAQMGASGNEARAAAGDKPGGWMRKQLEPLFDNAEAYEKFIRSVDAENRMFLLNRGVRGNSETAARFAEDMAPASETAGKMGDVAGAAGGVMHGNPVTTAFHSFRLMDRLKKERRKIPEDVAAQIAKIVSDPETSLRVLRGMPPPPGPAAAQTANMLGVIPGSLLGTEMLGQ